MWHRVDTMAHRKQFGPYTVEISRADKVLFPEDGVTKLDLCEHYERVAERMLPHLADRPLSLQRFPDGIGEEGFYQKDSPDWFPEWIRTERVPKKEGGANRQAVADNAATLVYLAAQATITLHCWTSTAEHLERPDRLVFDLDPSGDDFATVVAAARETREVLEQVGLTAWLLATGSRGLHVVSPIRPDDSFEEVHEIATRIADRVAARSPDTFTTEFRKDKRRGRLFLDTRRNLYAQTVVAPYAVRARPGAPVAVPLDWRELDLPDAGPRPCTIENVEDRLASDDPWSGMARRARGLDRVREALS